MPKRSHRAAKTPAGAARGLAAIKRKAIRKALRRHGTIHPCGSRASLDECFTYDDNAVYFWFNSADMNTHVIQECLLIDAPDQHPCRKE